MAHSRFLGFARNDKKERVVVRIGLLPWDSAVVAADAFLRQRPFGTTRLWSCPDAEYEQSRVASQLLGMSPPVGLRLAFHGDLGAVER